MSACAQTGCAAGVCVVQILCAIPGIPKTRVVTALVFTGVQPCALILLCEFYPWCEGPARARRHVSSPSGKYIKENSVERSWKERVYSSTPVCPSGVVPHRGRARNGFDSSDETAIYTLSDTDRQTDRRTDEQERETEGAINARAKERDERINLLCDKDKYIKEELKLDRVRE